MLFLFGNLILDVDQRELRRDGAAVSLQPQAFDLLEYLVRHRARVVTKDDLIAAIWGGRIVSDSTLATRINAVRTAIGDSGEAQEFVRTLPRKGFRFVGTVREAQKPEGPITPLRLEMSSDPAPISVDHERPEQVAPAMVIGHQGGGHGAVFWRGGRWAGRNLRPLMIVLALLAVFGFAPLATQYFHLRGNENQAAFRAPIGVLPFEPLVRTVKPRRSLACCRTTLSTHWHVFPPCTSLHG